MAQPRASKPVSAMLPSAPCFTHTCTRSPHIGLSPLAVASNAASRCAVARPAAVIEDHFLVQIAQVVEHHAKNSRTRTSASASASISVVRRVDAEAGARGAVEAEAVHQRLGAMMAGAHRDALAVEQRRDVVRVRPVEREADHAAAVLRAAR